MRTLLPAPRYKVTWKTLLLLVIGLVAFLVYIFLFNVDIRDIIAKVQQTNPYYYTLAAIASVFDIVFFTLAWHSLLRFLSVKLSVFKSFAFVWAGIFVDTLIPAESVSGEITKIYLVNREQTGAAGKATASVVAHRLIGMGINIAVLLVGAGVLLLESQLYGIVLGLILFLITAISVFFILVLLLCFREKWTYRIVDSVIRFAERISRGHWRLKKLRGQVVEIHRAFHDAIKDYAHAPRTLIVASLFTVIAWVLSMSVLYLTLASIGYPQISWSAILVTSAIFVAVQYVPTGIPFGVGLPEIALTTLLVFFGVPWTISATATILMRLLTLWLRFFIGFGAQQWIGAKAVITKQNIETGPEPQ
ncbi:MAG TPA: lysylphosphatidylglycerol synthase transmembrane domain-containing protein [Candidatus Acidoferrales bacterium]|nr:lysylphosphatidylglycerol synthase transmembrane domain-containing protein [Candidatus Acidoferrales bacterium]